MPVYVYTDFLETLDDAGRRVAEAMHRHIAKNHTEYKTHGVLPKNQTKTEWSLHFRKHPKHGKPLCSLFSNNGALSVRFMFYSTMVHEALLKLEEFGEQVRTGILRACRCSGCGHHGDKQFCWCQHHYYINNKLRYSCNTAWYTIDNIMEGQLSDRDIEDFLYLSDLQSKHMSRNIRESRGASHETENALCCGDIKIVKLEPTALDVDIFDPTDHADNKKLDRYTKNYSFTPMGTHNGLWFYFDENAACGTPNEDDLFTTIPDGHYAMITVSDPFTFSAIRTWDYICLWARKNNVAVDSVDIGEMRTPMLVKFLKQKGNQCMEMYVPIRCL